MKSFAWFIVLMFGAVNLAHAHFLFVVPAEEGSSAAVILSEDLKPDDQVGGSTVDAARLSCKTADGKSQTLTLDTTADVRQVRWTAEDACTIHGECAFGVMTRGSSKPYLLVYYPKTILIDAFGDTARLGDAAAAEIVPIGKPGELKFQLLAHGKPVADAELTVILPNGEQKKTKTDPQGQTEVFTLRGRYGVWARHFEAVAGDHQGQHYDETRSYPTLVVDIGDTKQADADASASGASLVTQFTPLPEATSSFGAVECDGWLYVYGGHIARTHSYSTAAVSGRFHRLNLRDGKTWEELPSGPGLQGMNLATHAGKIYRVGGMEPRNKPTEETDNHSVADGACFDPATGKWEALSPLSLPRSSHDVAVVGDKLFVIGGWNMEGTDGDEWLDTMQVLDLAASSREWTSIKQPFQRRALTVAVLNNQLYVFGGFDEDEEISLQTDIFDVDRGVWSTGPEIPGKKLNGFAPAACSHEGQLYLSVGNGSLYRLQSSEQKWEKIARTTPRMVHRMVSHESQILILGGAIKGDNFNLVEAVSPAPLTSVQK